LTLVGATKNPEGVITHRRGKRFILTEFKNSDLGIYIKNNIDYVNSLGLGGVVTTGLSSKIVSLWLAKEGIILKKITVRKKGKNKFSRKYMIK
jgi:hypothetical protein